MNTEAIESWLLGDARQVADLKEFTDQLLERLRTAGLDFARFSIGYQTLHPEVAALAFYWDDTISAVDQFDIGVETQTTSHYLVSPVRIIHEGGDMVRCRLEGEDAELDYAFLERLQAEGFTDYLMLGVPLSSNRFGPMTISTKRKGGFTSRDIDGLRTLRPLLGLHVEIHSSHHLAGSLLDVYLGHGTGERVLAGGIRRGSVQRYPAALLFCDLREFTALSERLPRNFIVHVLNDYFDEVGRAIDANGGEILKFIGDAALAVFPVGEGTRTEACDNALAAAQTLQQNLGDLNERRQGENKPPLGVGVGMHVGEVWYGNIGAANRLDFTVIGPAVNRAARLEKLASELKETILVSGDFAECCGTEFSSVGSYALKGIEGKTEAFRPA